MDMKTRVYEAMTYHALSPGQLSIFKALLSDLDKEAQGLSLEDLSKASDRTPRELQATLGALGDRVANCPALKNGQDKLELLLGKTHGRYHLTLELVEFIKATPSLEAVLRYSDKTLFNLHMPCACQFNWNDDSESGYLFMFDRTRHHHPDGDD